MEARLRNHVTSMPKIINNNLVQVGAYFVTKITFHLGSSSCQRGPHEQTDSDRILCSGEKVSEIHSCCNPKYFSVNSSWLTSGTKLFYRFSERKTSHFSIQVRSLFKSILFAISAHISDTDSFYIQFSDFTWEEAVLTLKSKIDFSNLPPDHDIFKTLDFTKYASERKAQFSYVKIDTAEKVIHAFLGEKKKSYNLFLSKNTEWVSDDRLSPGDLLDLLDRKSAKKGLPAKAAARISTKDLLALVGKPGAVKAGFKKLQSKNHIISMIHQEKMATNSFDNSALYKDCNMCNVPFDCDLKNIAKCTSIDCKKNKLLCKVWHGNFK